GQSDVLCAARLPVSSITSGSPPEAGRSRTPVTRRLTQKGQRQWRHDLTVPSAHLCVSSEHLCVPLLCVLCLLRGLSSSGAGQMPAAVDRDRFSRDPARVI